MSSLSLHCPAKVNLMLAVHGPRGDGFHGLTSVVVTLKFGDTLRVALSESSDDSLSCDDPAVPCNSENLILQAAQVFRRQTGQRVFFDFELEKRIPMGAGLGGGSSNAAAALRAMNQLTGAELSVEDLKTLSSELGSDCPLFIEARPTIMKGRGEILEPLSTELAERICGRPIVLFRPNFAINTGWAYRQLIKTSPRSYTSEASALGRIEDFQAGGSLHGLIFNTFENAVGAKYLAIPCLLEMLREAGHTCLMSGSGSCCFALPETAEEAMSIRQVCESAWGSGIFFIETLTN